VQALPEQDAAVVWPTDEWPRGEPRGDIERLEDALDQFSAQPPDMGVGLALVVVQGGRLVAERYGPDTTPDTPLISWSMAKSITHALVGIAVREGRLDIDTPAPVPEWAGDDRHAITTRQLLQMRDGLDFVEDYVDAEVSHCIDMLFGSGRDDVAAYAAARPLAHAPGTTWNYSSGTSNIVARIVGDAVGDILAFMHRELFDPLGMSSAVARVDGAGTFVGSSFVDATARDFARFGLLYLRDGIWDGRRLLPVGWVDDARTFTAHDPDGLFDYGAHWWLWRDRHGSFACHGYEGQFIVCVPDVDVVIVRLGKTPAELRPANVAHLTDVIESFATA
jgi:CubicO group peptidase (beta-lactamase class C family)